MEIMPAEEPTKVPMKEPAEETMKEPTEEPEEAMRPTAEGTEGLLASSWVRGIGPTYARRLTEGFGAEAAAVLRDDPLRAAAEVKGLSEARAAEAAESLRALPYPLELIAFLYSCGVGDSYVEKIFGKYRKRTAEVIARDPYAMVEDVWRLSFFIADKIGRHMGIATNDPRRLQGAIVTAVKHFADDGHLFARPDEAITYAADIAGVTPQEVEGQIDVTIADGRVVRSRGGLYLPVFYRAEKEGASKLSELAATPVVPVEASAIPPTDGAGHAYTPTQLAAIRMALDSPVSVLTGGPGSGKTTVVRAIIEALRERGSKVVLAAPTGRAAKRMSTLTGSDATTIHRLLGYREGEGYNHKPIDADALIIDEGSMMEQVLFNHLLQSLRPGTRVILVGDPDQLPAIGAGDVLRDLIASGAVPVARLDENFRQAAGSLIAGGAHAINSGEMPESDPERDFVIIPEPTTKTIHDRVLSLVATELPRERGIQPQEIQVVTPQQIGPLGARQLNADLQERINPDGPALRRGGTTMRLGDPVMQTANSRERGVYNGEVGRIVAVSPEQQTLDVAFSDGRTSTYARSELSELVLAYATTVHKLQGSEVKYMVFPITMAHKPMLYRNLLYTGVSRASELCVLVGEEEALRYAIGNTPAGRRNSNFRSRLGGN